MKNAGQDDNTSQARLCSQTVNLAGARPLIKLLELHRTCKFLTVHVLVHVHQHDNQSLYPKRLCAN